MPKKKSTSEERPPQDPTKVKHGCCSCTSYKLAMTQEPCKSCHDWNNWEDAAPDPQV